MSERLVTRSELPKEYLDVYEIAVRFVRGHKIRSADSIKYDVSIAAAMLLIKTLADVVGYYVED